LENKITYQERKNLLAIADINNSPKFSLPELKKILRYDELVKNNREKINIEGKI